MSNTDDLHSLSHTKWNCKYHIVFAPKYRRLSNAFRNLPSSLFFRHNSPRYHISDLYSDRGIYTADYLHPNTPTNTETCANFSVITVSNCLSLLDNSPVSLALYQRNLFFIRRKAEDFLKNLPRQCAGVPKRN